MDQGIMSEKMNTEIYSVDRENQSDTKDDILTTDGSMDSNTDAIASLLERGKPILHNANMQITSSITGTLLGSSKSYNNVSLTSSNVSGATDSNRLSFTIPKHEHLSQNEIYNTLCMLSLSKGTHVHLQKTPQGITVETSNPDAQHGNTTPAALHSILVEYTKMLNIQCGCSCIVFSPYPQAGYTHSFNIPTHQERLFHCIRTNHREISHGLNRLDSVLIINSNNVSGNFVTIASSQYSNLKTAVYTFLEKYYRIYTIEINDDIESHSGLITYRITNRINGHTSYKTEVTGTAEELNYLTKCNKNMTESRVGSTQMPIANVSFLVDAETSGFLSGKKFGKTNKITRTTECQITIQATGSHDGGASLNSELFKFSIFHTNLSSLIEALFLINMEYPSQLLFSIDYKHHKKIIGTSGKHIQRIMKKYDVYVKFMNEQEAESYPENVICKTPCKNKKNLELIQKEIMEIQGIKDEESTERQLKDEIPMIFEMIQHNARILQ